MRDQELSKLLAQIAEAFALTSECLASISKNMEAYGQHLAVAALKQGAIEIGAIARGEIDGGVN